MLSRIAWGRNSEAGFLTRIILILFTWKEVTKAGTQIELTSISQFSYPIHQPLSSLADRLSNIVCFGNQLSNTNFAGNHERMIIDD